MTEKKEKEIIPSEQELQVSELLREPMELGKVFAASGIFTDIKTVAQAVVKILAGKELGLSPIESMNSLYIVKDKIAVMAEMKAARIKKSAHYDYTVDKLDDNECSISFFSVATPDRKLLGISTYTLKDAAKAGIVNKDNWRNYPRNMLWARSMSNGARWYCPDALTSFYSVEELQDLSTDKPVVITMKNGEVKSEEATNGKEEL